MAAVFAQSGHRNALGSSIYGDVLVQSQPGCHDIDTTAQSIRMPTTGEDCNLEQWNGTCSLGQRGFFFNCTVDSSLETAVHDESRVGVGESRLLLGISKTLSALQRALWVMPLQGFSPGTDSKL